MVEFIARNCLESFGGDPATAQASPSADDEQYDAVRGIREKWMMTPRVDLENRTPREVLLEKHDFIDRDLEDRAEQWSQSGDCPRGLDSQSAAFRLAGFGTHEIVTYYELVRYLLWSCHDAVRSLASRSHPEAMTVEDFLTSEVPRLLRLCEEWLDQPDPEFHGRTPRSIILRERARLPEAVCGEEAIIDHDCPLCQMQADLPGIGFWHLDGCNMDDDFAFSFHRTREEWEAEQRDYEEFNRRFDAKQSERQQLGVEFPGGGSADSDYAWQRSFSTKESSGDSILLRLFSIGSHLADLIVDLKQPLSDCEVPTSTRALIDRLCRDFGNLREVAQSHDLATTSALIEPVLNNFCESLEEVAATLPEREPQCSDLQNRLRQFLEAPSDADDTTDADEDADSWY